MSSEIVLVRHGETEWSRSMRHTGNTDLPLTEEGERQATAVAPRLVGREFALVLCSPRQRARDTAKLAGFSTPEVDPDLAELEYGPYEGRTTEEIRVEQPGWSVWKDPGGETLANAAARADRVIARALAADGDSLLFAHGHILRILGARWIGLDMVPTVSGGLASDRALARALAGGHVVLANARPPGQAPINPISLLLFARPQQPEEIGFIDAAPELDGVARHAGLFVSGPDGPVPSFPAVLALKLQGHRPRDPAALHALAGPALLHNSAGPNAPSGADARSTPRGPRADAGAEGQAMAKAGSFQRTPREAGAL